MSPGCKEFAQIITSTVREPFLVLSDDLRVIGASRAFYHRFQVSPEESAGRSVYLLGEGQWDIPDLRRLLEKVILDSGLIEDVEVRHHFRSLGEVTMRLNARRILAEDGRAGMILLAIEDVTGQVPAAADMASLPDSERRYRLLFENMNEGFALAEMIWDDEHNPVDWRYIEVNRAWSQTGVSPADTVGRTAREVNPRIEREWIETYGRVVQTGQSVAYENYAAGFDKWFTTFAFKHSENRFGLFFIDITERKRTEERLRESEERFRVMQENSLDRLTIVKPFYDDRGKIIDFIFVYHNAQAAKLAGLGPEDVVGRRMSEIWPTYTQTDFFAKYKEVVETRQPTTFEDRYVGDGVDEWFHVMVIPIPDGIAITSRIITERKRTENLLKEREKRLRLATDAAQLGIFAWEIRNDKPLWDNARMYEIFGLSPQDPPIDREQFEREVIHPDDLPRFRREIMEGMLNRTLFRGKYRIRRRNDGQLRWIQYLGTFEFAENGEAIRLLSVLSDITEREQAKEQLERANERLERNVEERTRELQETQLKYLHSEKLSAVGRLSASIAHEFNNPLQAIMTVLTGLQKTLPLQGRDGELLEMAVGETKRMKNLIRNLQDFHRPSSDKKVLVDVHTLLDSLVLLCKTDWRRKGIAIVLEYDQRMPHIVVVPDQIKQLLLNLLQNAADACGDGKGKISIRTCHDERGVAITVADNGIGIAPDKMGMIFQPFYTTKPEVKGTGLGLSICHGIVQAHDGEIRVESEPGKGSAFTVFLPFSSS